MSTLTRVGSSMMVVIPARIIKLFGLKERDLMDIDIEGDRIVMNPKKRPRRSRYLLDDLMAECDMAVPHNQDILEWEQQPRAGRELI